VFDFSSKIRKLTDVASATAKPGAKPRLWHKSLIESSGSVLGGADANSVLPGDFVIPSDESIPRSLSVTFESLDIFSAVESGSNSIADGSTPLTDIHGSRIKICSAMMTFIIEAESEKEREISLALGYDIRFVTAHPCLPSPHTNIIRTPTSPSFHISEKSSIKSALFSSIP
jgi:hypothetical protein